MNKLTQYIQSHPARFFLVLFLLMIIPAIILYSLAESGSLVGMGIFLALIIGANTAALFS